MKNSITEKKPESRKGIKRRDFFRLLGGGIFIFIYPWKDSDEPLSVAYQQKPGVPTDFNAFLHIAEDGTVTCYTGKVEMGQGSVTGLNQMMADEIRVPYGQVKMVVGDTDLVPWDSGTNGSTSIRVFGVQMRNAAAEARMVLVGLASEKLGVPADKLEAFNGTVRVKNNTKSKVSYTELTRGQRIEKHLDSKPVLTSLSDYQYVGKSIKRNELELKVTGKAIYTGDMKLPGMVYARILRPPSHDATLVSADTSEAEKIEGVRIIRDKELIAVLHGVRDIADQALAKVKGEYSFKEKNVNDKTIFKYLVNAPSVDNVVVNTGSMEEGKKNSATILESEFYNSYIAHAPLEPHVALASYDGDRLTVWASTQGPFPTKDDIVRNTGLPPEKVRVIAPFLGGAFGGKNANPQAVEVARIALKAKVPVMLLYSREEEFFMDTFRPASYMKISTGMDQAGKIQMWGFDTYHMFVRGHAPMYDVPNVKIVYHNGEKNSLAAHPLSVGPWRAPSCNSHIFAKESHVDIMALKAGMDPLEFRLKNLNNPDMTRVLKAVADKFSYTPSIGPSGRGYGMAIGTDVGTWTAQMAEVTVDKATGQVRVVRVVCGQNMGLCVNPEASVIQAEGGIIMAIGFSLAEEIQFENGVIKNLNFDNYKIPLFSWMPKIENIILESESQVPYGSGEPPIICTAAAIANAIFDATGARLYHLPMTPERVLEALKKI